MTLGDTVSLAARNLGQAKLRTALTMLGVSIGIASLSGMVSLGVGLERQFVSRFTNAGLFDAITVTSTRAPFPGFGRSGRGRGPVPFGRRGGPTRVESAEPAAPPAPDPPLPALDDAAIASFAALPHVKDAYPNIRLPVQLTFDGLSEFGAVVGVPLSTRGQGAFQTMRFGTFFANDTDRACILSYDLATRMIEGDASKLIGRELTFSYVSKTQTSGDAATVPPVPSVPSVPNVPPGVAAAVASRRVAVTCRILGAVERDPAVGGAGVQALVAGVMIPISQAKAIDVDSMTSTTMAAATPNRGAGYPAVTIKVERSQFTKDVQTGVRALGFQTFSIIDAIEDATRAFIILDIVLGLIGSIALAVSSLGIMNTMVMSILERTREIGVMKAIGGSDADVRGIFLVEASVIGVIGGAAGVFLGWAVSRVINIGANIYIERQGGTAATLFSMPWWLILGAIGFSLLVSLAAGSYPARRAARLDPIQALRHD